MRVVTISCTTTTVTTSNIITAGIRFLVAVVAASALSVVLLGGGCVEAAVLPEIKYACDPCLDRSTYMVQAIVHGTESDPFWQQVHASAKQAATDMDVELRMELYGTYNPTKMASDIIGVTKTGGTNRPEALVVSIPSDEVRDAVQQVVNAGIPVLGINVGAATGKEIGVLDFVSPDDTESGRLAAAAMLNHTTAATGVALFVTDEANNNALSERLEAFSAGLDSSTGSSWLTEELVVDGINANGMASLLDTALEGCPYQAVLLSGTRTLPHAIAAYKKHGCSFDTIPLGAFDTTKEVLDAIGNDQLAFTIGQQQAMQGALAVQLAALKATTGKSLARSADTVGGAYLSGPHLITKRTLPTDTIKDCEDAAFPVCPNTQAPGERESVCECTDRSKIKIGGVTHGVTTDDFWLPVYAASKQAAVDMGVQLFNEPFAPEEEEATLHNKMANRIKALCEQEGVDGLFVSIPSDIVKPAIQTCLDLNIPVMSINAGADASEEMGLMHHIGMLEFNAGRGAGEHLAKDEKIERAVCINHAQGVNVVEQRCAGFEKALEMAGVSYIGEVFVPDDNQAQYIELVEEKVGDKDGDWDKVGILAAGGPQHVPVIALQARHPKAVVGAFDTSSELYDAVDAGIKEFGIDQQPYVQGYMPVALLTYAVYTEQTVSNPVIESGPAFVEASPSEAQQVCEEKMYEACAKSSTSPSASSTSNGSSANYTGLIIALVVLAVVFAIAIAYLAYRLHKLNQYVKKLQEEGKDVPELSFSQRISSTMMPVDKVVESAVQA